MDEQDQKIRERAYRLWEEEGRPEGREDEHWERARRELEGDAKPAVEDRDPAEEEPAPAAASRRRRAAPRAPDGKAEGERLKAEPSSAKASNEAVARE